VPDTFELCTELIQPGGHVANIGVHGTPATRHLEDLWIKNVTITTGLVGHVLHPDASAAHRGRAPGPASAGDPPVYARRDARCHEIFGNAAETDVLTVVLSAAGACLSPCDRGARLARRAARCPSRPRARFSRRQGGCRDLVEQADQRSLALVVQCPRLGFLRAECHRSEVSLSSDDAEGIGHGRRSSASLWRSPARPVRV
jgi:hypothetical protein